MMTKPRLYFTLFIFLSGVLLFASGCAPSATPTPFRPPTLVPPTQPLPTITSIPLVFTAVPLPAFTPTADGPCINDLKFISDITIPDNSIVLPNSSIDKQWLVENTGSCHWNSSYRLKWLGGDPLGAVQEQPLFPARAGTQATLQILFIAPSIPGIYESSWQAMSPDGNLFGDLVYIQIAVSQ